MGQKALVVAVRIQIKVKFSTVKIIKHQPKIIEHPASEIVKDRLVQYQEWPVVPLMCSWPG